MCGFDPQRKVRHSFVLFRRPKNDRMTSNSAQIRKSRTVIFFEFFEKAQTEPPRSTCRYKKVSKNFFDLERFFSVFESRFSRPKSHVSDRFSKMRSRLCGKLLPTSRKQKTALEKTSHRKSYKVIFFTFGKSLTKCMGQPKVHPLLHFLKVKTPKTRFSHFVTLSVWTFFKCRFAAFASFSGVPARKIREFRNFDFDRVPKVDFLLCVFWPYKNRKTRFSRTWGVGKCAFISKKSNGDGPFFTHSERGPKYVRHTWFTLCNFLCELSKNLKL